MIVKEYNIEQTIIHMDDSFLFTTDDEKERRIKIFNDFLLSLAQKENKK